MADSGGEAEGMEEAMKQVMKRIDDIELDLTPLDPHREILAGLQAARLIRTRRRVTSVEDLDTFSISLHASKEDYLRLMKEIQDFIRKVQSMRIFRKPVTPPAVALHEEEYYIVKLTKPDDVNKCVNKLFRASDMYLLAFQPCGTGIKQPFFRFSDVELPTWIDSVPLSYNSSHGKHLDSLFGAHWWDHIFHKDFNCTENNSKTHDAKASQWSILLLAEPPRLLSLQNDVVNVISDGGTADVGCSEEGIHNWLTLSKIGFRYVLKPSFEKSMLILHENTKYNLFNAETNKYEPWAIVGPRGEILIFKYDHLLVTNIIKREQDEALKTLHIGLQEQPLPSSRILNKRIDASQRPSIPILLCYILLREEELSPEVKQAAGVFLRRSIQNEFSSMVQSNKDYIKSELLFGIWEPIEIIRSSAQETIINILARVHGAEWPELFDMLHSCLDSEMSEHIKGAMELLHKVCSQMPHELEFCVPRFTQPPITVFFKKWVMLFVSPDRDVRRFAIACVNCCIASRPSILDLNMDQYLDALVNLYENNWATEDENGWEERHAAAMSMSAIAEECTKKAHCCLPQVILIITQLMREDALALVSLACGTISKYSKYILQRLSCEDGCKQFEEIIDLVFENNRHNDRSVQLNASAALADIEKEYSTLEDVISKLNSERNPFPRLRCLKSIAKAVRPGFYRFLVPVFRECIGLLRSELLAKKECNRIISCRCMQLISSLLAQGLPAGNESSSENALPSSAGFQNLIEKNNLISMLAECCADGDVHFDVRESAMKLLGDISKVVQVESLAKVLAKVRRIIRMEESE